MNLPRLKRATLEKLPAQCVRPPTPNAGDMSQIVHLGIGAFHRAHQALYTQQARANSEPNWRIIGASLRSGGVRDQLAPQDYLYHVVSRDGSGERYQLVDVIDAVLVAPENPQALIAAMAAPDTAIVSLTVTEKGYCHTPDSGQLDKSNPDIRHDLANPATPRSAPGLLVAALARRRQDNTGGLTILSCDNLPHNGRVCQTIVLALAAEQHPSLAEWIAAEVSFPSTMVDRIVPATRAADRQALAEVAGVEDRGMVVCEPFSQWVIEDRFVAGRPAWESAGALMVPDVTPYEHMKLRLLNGSHSSMAYLGQLAGHDYMHQVIADGTIGPFIVALMDRELSPGLDVPEGFQLEAYKEQLRQRFANPALQHRTAQVAMDGSQKIPQRLLQPLRQQLARGGSIDGICIAVAAWMAYVAAVEVLDDPLADEIHSRLDSAGRNPAAITQALLGLEVVFGADLPLEAAFVETVTRQLGALQNGGLDASLVGYLEA